MALLSIHDISLSFGGEPLLDRVSLNIERGDRACIIGRNGTGKSSLMKLIHGDISPDEGEIRSQKGLRVAYLPQTLPTDVSGPVVDIVASGLQGLQDCPQQQHSATSPKQVIGKVISHLALTADADFEALSGGQKRRVILARALVREPDLLLLDEPTNHLDIDSICWMENYLLRHCTTFLFVTHDRAFLRRLANRIIDLDRGQLAHWACGYDEFLRRKSELLHDESVRQQAFDKKLAKEEVWIRKGIKARRTRDEGRVRALMQMREERRARRASEGTARLSLQDAGLSGRKVIETKGITFAYADHAPVVQDLSLRIMREDRVGIIGPNGSGKTTLLKLFTGELTPQTGELIHGTKLETGYFDQHRALLDDAKTVAYNVGDGSESLLIGGKQRHVISYLQDFLFTPDRANAPVKVLSGGERNRLLLARLFAKPSNLIIMDEPTNDLDTETLELLEEQLMNYRGTVLIVSHDRAFLNNVITNLLVVEGSGVVNPYIGGYDDWLRSQQLSSDVQPKSKPTKTNTPRPFGFKQNRELNALPKKIEKLEKEQESLHARMAQPDYFQTSPDQIQVDKEETDRLALELETMYERWQELEELRHSGE